MGVKNRIVDLAKSKNMSIAELERSVGLSNGQIGKWDKRSPQALNLEKIADYFNVSVDYLLGRDTNNLKQIPAKPSEYFSLIADENNLTEEQKAEFQKQMRSYMQYMLFQAKQPA